MLNFSSIKNGIIITPKLSELNPKAETRCVTTEKEVVGLRGAQTAVYGINPDIGIAVDVTFATDLPSKADAVKRENLIKLDGGPVLTRGPNIIREAN